MAGVMSKPGCECGSIGSKLADALRHFSPPLMITSVSFPPTSRKVHDKISGATYDSVLIAATTHGHKMKTLYNWLSGHRPNHTALEFA